MVFMTVFVVRFQYVSAEKHPEHYCRKHGSHPAKLAREVPGRHWTQVEVRHTNREDAEIQYQGLQFLAEEGELIRSVGKWTSSVDGEDLVDDEDAEQREAVDDREHCDHQ